MKELSRYITESLDNRYFDLIAVGDILPHRPILDAVHTEAGYDFSSIFRYLKPIMKDYDICFCNQETIIGGGEVKGGKDDKVRKDNKTAVVFNGPDSLGDCIIDTGFNMISLANNHMYDMEKSGLDYSRKYWSKKPVISSGQDEAKPESRVKLFKKNGIRVAFVAYTTFINRFKHKDVIIPYTNIYSYNTAQNDIQYAKANADVVIVSIHWGTEYMEELINYEQKTIAQQLSDLGVDIILGHHPHVVQQIGYVGKTLCVYSLGNCIACQQGDSTCKRIGGMISLRVHNNNGMISLKNIKPCLLYMYYTEDYSDFCVIPFNQLDDTKLIGFREIQKEYENKFRIL